MSCSFAEPEFIGPRPPRPYLCRLVTPQRPVTAGNELVILTSPVGGEIGNGYFRFGFGGSGDDLLVVDLGPRLWAPIAEGIFFVPNDPIMVQSAAAFRSLIYARLWVETLVEVQEVEEHVRNILAAHGVV